MSAIGIENPGKIVWSLALLFALLATGVSCRNGGGPKADEFPPCPYCKSEAQLDAMTGRELLQGFMDCEDDIEWIPAYTRRIEAMEAEGIPIFLRAMEEGIKERASIIHMNWVGYSADSLHRLAQRGIYTDDEVPVLIHVIKNQLYMPSTFVTAESLRIITGVDPGYSEEYVRTWTGDPESQADLTAKIAKWEAWWKDHERQEPGPK